MAQESPRIAELRRRVHADPASIAFAQLAEEYRRAGNYAEAVKYCRTGLARHPGYLSARVTLGRALSEIGGLDEAAREFELVLKSAPDNLAAIRGMAEICHRRGEMSAALDLYKRALALARFDPELEETVNRIGREMGAAGTTSSPGAGQSFEEISSQLSSVSGRTSETGSSTPPSSHSEAPVARTPDAAGPEPLIDFDALLASLGIPDAAPPPLMEMLLSGSPVPDPRPGPITSPAQATAPVDDGVGDLERELRALDQAPATSPEHSVATVVIEELEAWLRVLHSERAAQSA